ncbi:MAG: hypothetical protein ACRYFS_14750 [Janthinobacterium lividum]
MLILELSVSFIVLAALSLMTALVRRTLIRLRSGITSTQHQTEKTNQANQRSKDSRSKDLIYGRIGVGISLVGFYLPVVLFFWFLNYQDSVLNNPEMEDWETSSGWWYVHLCERSIIFCQLLAAGFGVLARRTALGSVVFVLAVALTYMALCRLPGWYFGFTRF